MPELAPFLEMWFDDVPDLRGDPAAVGGLLRFNRPASAGTSDGDVELLVVEDQGVWLWGRDQRGRHVERANEPGAQWRSTGESAEEFWLHHAAFDAVLEMPARRSARGFDAATVRRLVDAVTPLPCRPWAWPGTGHSLFHRGPAVVMVCDDDGDHWVVAAAPDEADLAWLDGLDLSWDESDSRAVG